MTTKAMEFVLEKTAARSGGDRYECTEDDRFKIYVPQYISREGGAITERLLITFTKGE